MLKLLVPRLKPRYGISDWISAINIFERDSISEYESEFSEKFGCKYGVMFSHGRSAIYALLKIWEIENCEVVCPAYTCVVVPDAIVLSGNIPVFVDCEVDSFNMSLQGIRESITERTRVIVATHLFGYPMDVDEVEGIANEASEKYGHKVYVIQDCAHSYGARWNGGLVTEKGDAAIFGCNISKIINSIFGGMVVTNNEETCRSLNEWKEEECSSRFMLKTVRRFSYFISVNVAFLPVMYSFVNWLEKKGFLDRFVRYYEEGKISFPNDWDENPVAIEARVGRSQLEKYDNIISQRITWSKNIVSYFEENKTINFLKNDAGATYSHLVGVVENRDDWVNAYLKKGIQLGILIEYSIPNMIAYKRYKTVEVPNSDYYSERCVNFPLHRAGGDFLPDPDET